MRITRKIRHTVEHIILDMNTKTLSWRRAASLLSIVFCLSGCGLLSRFSDSEPRFDIQAHRGGRGLAPENTLAAFRQAMELGVNTLETDLAMTRDRALILSHDPYLNPAFVRGPDGKWLSGKGPSIFSMSLDELASYDIGRLNPANPYGKNFPAQEPADGERFPSLAQLFALARASGKNFRFNLETKITPGAPDETPDPELFARALVDAIRAAGLERRASIQSFDWRTLVHAKKIAPEIRTVCLTIESAGMSTVSANPEQASPWHAGYKLSDHDGVMPAMVKAAGCEVWSMFWRNLTPQVFAQAKSYGLLVIPWTVNEPQDMRVLIALGVDGLITDYPDRLIEVMGTPGKTLRTK